jgi:hypothetical protein
MIKTSCSLISPKDRALILGPKNRLIANPSNHGNDAKTPELSMLSNIFKRINEKLTNS